MIRLRYGNTNTFYIPAAHGGLLIDTDYAGTLPAFWKALKQNGLTLRDIRFVLPTHFHPDHTGLIGELTAMGVTLLLADVQRAHVHDPDAVFAREPHLHREPIDETKALCISCKESRAFLREIGISGEIIATPSHSPDSISLILDNGDCFVGDLEPLSYLPAYGENPPLRADWERVLSCHPKRIFYAHANEVHLDRA
ncbi:MAG: MBL fold metallo-hydrolase [Oscillospiraceae bacterium]|nr:MBL fold metallo-hydrolase [Oscillospiraceae bacterium]